MKLKLRQHVPNFVSTDDIITEEFTSIDELLTLQVVKRMTSNSPGGHVEFSLSDLRRGGPLFDMLLVTYNHLYWWVVGYITPEDETVTAEEFEAHMKQLTEGRFRHYELCRADVELRKATDFDGDEITCKLN